MSSSNSTKGTAKLARILQSRMNRTSSHGSGIMAERGEIVSGRKLKVYSLPDIILGRDDYSVCFTVNETRPLQVGDRVLVIWTYDGEPVVIDRIIEADSI